MCLGMISNTANPNFNNEFHRQGRKKPKTSKCQITPIHQSELSLLVQMCLSHSHNARGLEQTKKSLAEVFFNSILTIPQNVGLINP